MNVKIGESATYFNLAISNPLKKKLNVQVSSNNLGVLVDTVVSSIDFIQRYNMNMVEDGQYTVSVKNGKEQLLKKIELKTIITRNMELVK